MDEYFKSLDELKEFVDELPLANSIKNQLAKKICDELHNALIIGARKGFADAINLNENDLQELIEKASQEFINNLKPSNN